MTEIQFDQNLDQTLPFAFSRILTLCGFDLTDPNFKDTPKRMGKVYQELLYGHSLDARLELREHLLKTFPSDLDEMVVVRNVDSVGVCPHHLLPVSYTTHVAYIPDQKVIGYSKIPRLVKILSSRAELQEQLVSDIADTLMDSLSPKGVAVHMTGVHSCAKIRGVKSHNADMVICCLRGCLKNSDSRLEFLSMIAGK